MPLTTLRDKIAGGWAGQMIGVSFAEKSEFQAQGVIFEGLFAWDPAMVERALKQDDLYVDMTFAEALNTHATTTSEEFGKVFASKTYPLWHANLAARRNLKRGIRAGDSGSPRYNVHTNDIDFQIESDFIGLMTPLLYNSAMDIAIRAGSVVNSGEGIHGGIFMSCMYSAAFFEREPVAVVSKGLACLPAQSPYAQVIADVLRLYKTVPDWRKAWEQIETKWDKNDPCPEGALRQFNIDAKLNGAFVALGLLYGQRDFGKTIEIAARAGQDSDCNASTAGGILGVMLGRQGIPFNFGGGIQKIADAKFENTIYTFNSIVAATEARAKTLIEDAGGHVKPDRVLILEQRPHPRDLPLWDYGTVAERVGIDDPRWTWTAPLQWAPSGGSEPARTASQKGATASVRFNGTGAIVTGKYLPTGGKLDAYIDGKHDLTLDVNSDSPDETRSMESVYHVFGLKPGDHTIRIVVRGEPYGMSNGADVAITGLVRFTAKP